MLLGAFPLRKESSLPELYSLPWEKSLAMGTSLKLSPLLSYLSVSIFLSPATMFLDFSPPKVLLALKGSSSLSG